MVYVELFCVVCVFAIQSHALRLNKHIFGRWPVVLRSSLASSSDAWSIVTDAQGVCTLSVDIGGGKNMSFETGRIGKQASGSILAKFEDTMVIMQYSTKYILQFLLIYIIISFRFIPRHAMLMHPCLPTSPL